MSNYPKTVALNNHLFKLFIISHDFVGWMSISVLTQLRTEGACQNFV